MEEEYKELELNGVKLRVFRNGAILKYGHKASRGKIMDWRPQLFKQNASYYRICLKGKLYLVHRIIGMAFLGLDIEDLTQHIDHIDMCKKNNNINNLRIVTPTENMWNLSTNKKGYYFIKATNKYCAQIKLNGKTTHIGNFNTEEEARHAYLAAKAKYHIISHYSNHHLPQL
jgi:hypothetical protein